MNLKRIAALILLAAIALPAKAQQIQQNQMDVLTPFHLRSKVIDYTTTGTARAVTRYESGVTFTVSETNDSDDGAVGFTLPKAERHMWFRFVDMDSTAGSDVTITCDTGDVITSGTTRTTYVMNLDHEIESVELLCTTSRDSSTDGVWMIQNESPGNRFPRVVLKSGAQGTTDTLTVYESGTTFIADGATTATYVELPPAQIGLQFTFTDGDNTAGDDFYIYPNISDIIANQSAGVGLVADDDTSATISLMAVSGTDWHITSMHGQWDGVAR